MSNKLPVAPCVALCAIYWSKTGVCTQLVCLRGVGDFWARLIFPSFLPENVQILPLC